MFYVDPLGWATMQNAKFAAGNDFACMSKSICIHLDCSWEHASVMQKMLALSEDRLLLRVPLSCDCSNTSTLVGKVQLVLLDKYVSGQSTKVLVSRFAIDIKIVNIRGCMLVCLLYR
mmetsp:Transcript_19373/g.28256  ORF Transcript_19373/g.28256 Transcript_19373/m.28256 type:complete len:117 (-) Transcript_19373:310-660(-)